MVLRSAEKAGLVRGVRPQPKVPQPKVPQFKVAGPGAKPTASAATAGRPAVVYLKNLAGPPVGAEPDEPILSDLLRDGFVVLVFDLQKDPRAAAPWINADLRRLRQGIGRLLSAEAIDEDHVYILPAGDRLKRDIVYYGQGDQAYRLDLRYPSRPRQPTPVLMQIPVTNDNRMNNRFGHCYYNDLIAEAALTRGYAVAQVDPPLKTYVGLDPMPEVAWRFKAAVRTIRSQASACGFSDRIGVLGFSAAAARRPSWPCPAGSSGSKGTARTANSPVASRPRC